MAQTITPKSKAANVAEEAETAEVMVYDIKGNPGDLLAVIRWCKFTNESLIRVYGF